MREFARCFALVIGIGFFAGGAIAQSNNLEELLGGKTLTSPKGRTVYVLGSDGSLGGIIAKQKVVGTWEIRDGQWCRSIVEPKERVGDACRIVEVKGEDVWLSGDDQTTVYTVK